MIVLGIENEPMGPWVVHAESWTSPMNASGYLVGAFSHLEKYESHIYIYIYIYGK